MNQITTPFPSRTDHRQLMKPTKLHLLALLGAALLTALPSVTHGQTASNNPPTQLTYQGFLTDANGAPLGNASPVNKTIQFRIFAAESGGTALWASSQVVTVDKGHFSVLLGQGSAVGSESFNNDLTSLFTTNGAANRYVELTVDGAALAPRLRFLPAPYAMLATKAMTVDTNASLLPAQISGTFAANQIPNLNASKIDAGTLSTDRIPNLDATKVTTGTLTEARIPRNLPGTLTVSTLSATSFQGSALALINVVYPVGVFYVQYPNVDTTNEAIAFPSNQSPGSLFPGTTWQERFTDGVFFRTKGGNAGESRGTNGIQDYGLKRLTGFTGWFQSDYNDSNGRGDGVFNTAVTNKWGRTDSGFGNGAVIRSYFDSSLQATPSSTEVRPANRLMKVWQRSN